MNFWSEGIERPKRANGKNLTRRPFCHGALCLHSSQWPKACHGKVRPEAYSAELLYTHIRTDMQVT